MISFWPTGVEVGEGFAGQLGRGAVDLVGCSQFYWVPEPFDSKHFGLKMLKLLGARGPASAIESDARTWVAGLAAHGWEHAAVRVPCSNPSAIQALEAAGFRYMDTHAGLTWSGRYVPKPDDRIREADRGDLGAIQDLSIGIFELSRYAWDSALSPQGLDSLLREWVANDFGGRADKTFVAVNEGQVAGYLAALWDEESAHAVIDLVAVSAASRGKGLGRALVDAFLAQYRLRASRLSVGTQGGNHEALALYQSCGFRISHSEVSLHLDLRSNVT